MTGFTDCAIAYRMLDRVFLDIRAKPAVKEDNDAAIILVNISAIRAMMGAVIGGRIKDIFYPFGQFTHRFGMNKKLINQIKRIKEKYPNRMDAE